MTIKCNLDDVLAVEHDGGKALGIVRRGMVKVIKGDKTVALLGEGDVFGEIASILNMNRSANLVAATSDTEVLLFSVSAIKRLKDQSDKTIIWQNLAIILARKVLETTNLLS